MSAVGLEGSAYPETENGGIQDTVWTADGRVRIDEGTAVEFGVAPSGMATSMEWRDLDFDPLMSQHRVATGHG